MNELQNPQVKRMRKYAAGFTASFKVDKVPLDAPIPKHTGFARRPLPFDELTITGTTADGKTKTIHCGPYSPELLAATQAALENK